MYINVQLDIGIGKGPRPPIICYKVESTISLPTQQPLIASYASGLYRAMIGKQ